ncbi:MAG: deoxyribodipyrimidine photo-lyase, partial [Microthrixaceae bacterium]|nr:deoxyribodipyrimidine photo-lyase [Microthrixaceae bacterium]
MTSHGLVWFRKDLRLIDNPAWAAALDGCARITALFVLDPAIIDQTGPHRRAQLAAHLSALDEDLQAIGGHLWLLRGDPGELVPKAVEELGADALYANADAAPGSRRRDRRVFEALQDTPPERRPGDEPVPFHTFWGTLVLPPDSVTTKSGDEVSKVFTPFYKRWRDTDWDSWPTTDAHAGQPEFASTSSVLADHAIRLDDLPGVDEEPHHSGGARAALGRLGAATKGAARYSEVRDRPDLAATSELSVDLHFGTLSPRQAASALGDAEGGQALVRQLAWRDWYAHLLWEHPHLTDRAMRSEYDAIEWQNDEAEFEAWQRGDTGYPIVDAGMRQL